MKSIVRIHKVALPLSEALLVAAGLWDCSCACCRALMWLGRGWTSCRELNNSSFVSSLMWLSSSHTHSSQQPSWSGLTNRGREQRSSGRGICWGQRGIQPTTPSMQVHWYRQLGRKSSPCWYTCPLNSQGRPWASAANDMNQSTDRLYPVIVKLCKNIHFPEADPQGVCKDRQPESLSKRNQNITTGDCSKWISPTPSITLCRPLAKSKFSLKHGFCHRFAQTEKYNYYKNV